MADWKVPTNPHRMPTTLDQISYLSQLPSLVHTLQQLSGNINQQTFILISNISALKSEFKIHSTALLNAESGLEKTHRGQLEALQKGLGAVEEFNQHVKELEKTHRGQLEALQKGLSDVEEFNQHAKELEKSHRTQLEALQKGLSDVEEFNQRFMKPVIRALEDQDKMLREIMQRCASPPSKRPSRKVVKPRKRVTKYNLRSSAPPKT
ncbi:MAG: hypothetical protein M1816_008236 [Peltula sp. TS41687]|nr:MAG: hypothetical protein M1816_008236 [Peltula sp. TS41687]